MTRKRIVWKNDELREKNIESTRIVTEKFRIAQSCLEKAKELHRIVGVAME